jgi:hypothetical protein
MERDEEEAEEAEEAEVAFATAGEAYPPNDTTAEVRVNHLYI